MLSQGNQGVEIPPQPALSIPGATVRYSDIDILVVRENMEGLYSGVGHIRSEDGERAELTSVVTRKGSTRIIRHAFKLATQLHRGKVTFASSWSPA